MRAPHCRTADFLRAWRVAVEIARVAHPKEADQAPYPLDAAWVHS